MTYPEPSCYTSPEYKRATRHLVASSVLLGFGLTLILLGIYLVVS